MGSATFSFKVLCPTDFDCATTAECCTPDEPPLPAIDYTAKDFQSIQQALTEFSAQRYPAWQERSEADFGVMFMEALCALADELSYLQDRVAAESTLLGATQRRPLVSMARLVDYEPQPCMSATTTMQCNVTGTTVPAGALITATRPDGVVVPFEIGLGLADTTHYPVSPAWNDGIQPYCLDYSQQCLPCGSTGMWVLGHGFGFATAQPGTALLIQTDLPGESIREVVHVTGTEILDTVFPGGTPTPVTHISWLPAEALTRDRDLTHTLLAGNLLPATQGRRFSEAFAVGTPPPAWSSLPVAIARRGPNGTDAQPNWITRYPLSKASGASGQFNSALSALAALTTGAQPRLTWLLPAGGSQPGTLIDSDIVRPAPELVVNRRLPEPQLFTFATSLLDATATETAYTVDPAAWRVVGASSPSGAQQWEYDGDQGDTLRFGDGVFGEAPAEGDVFDVEYRIGLGASGNVAAEAIRNIDPSATAYLTSVRNPFAVTNGLDMETAQHIQRMAPQAFRAVQYRAVLAEDYAAAAPPAGMLTVIAQSYPGLRKVLNPVAVGGGSDPDPASLLKQYAPRSVLTFGRAVSVFDYQALAAQASGVTMAQAVWSWDANNQQGAVTVYVACPNVAGPVQTLLSAAGDPNRPVTVLPATQVAVTLTMTLIVTAGMDQNAIQTAVQTALCDPQTGLFSPPRIAIGQGLFDSGIEEVCLAVSGVVAIVSSQFEFNGAVDSGPLHSPGEGNYFSLDPTNLNQSIGGTQ